MFDCLGDRVLVKEHVFGEVLREAGIFANPSLNGSAQVCDRRYALCAGGGEVAHVAKVAGAEDVEQCRREGMGPSGAEVLSAADLAARGSKQCVVRAIGALIGAEIEAIREAQLILPVIL